MYNFADDNSLSAISRTAAELKNTSQSESEVVVNWFKSNRIIVNPEKVEAIILDKQKHGYLNETIKFDNKTFETVSSVRLLGIPQMTSSNLIFLLAIFVKLLQTN